MVPGEVSRKNRKNAYHRALQTMYVKVENKWQAKGLTRNEQGPKKTDKGTGRKESVEKEEAQWNGWYHLYCILS